MAKFQQPKGDMFQQRKPGVAAQANDKVVAKVVVGAQRLPTTDKVAGKAVPGDFVHPRSQHNVICMVEHEGDQWMQLGRFRWIKSRDGVEVLAAVDGVFPKIGPDHPRAPWRALLKDEQARQPAVRAEQASAWEQIDEDADDVGRAIAEAAIDLMGLAESAAKDSPFSTLMDALAAHHSNPGLRVGLKGWSAPIAALVQAEGRRLAWASPAGWDRHPLQVWPINPEQLETTARAKGLWRSNAGDAALDDEDIPVGSIVVATEPDGVPFAATAIGLSEQGHLLCVGSAKGRPVSLLEIEQQTVLGVVAP